MKEMIIQLAGEGTIRIRLWPKIAPIACASIKKIADKGKYDHQPIQRLEPEFVIQPLFQDGLDPEIDELIAPEFCDREDNHRISFRRGIVAMAGTADQASGSQYFICLKAEERLNGHFTVIGEVIDGWDAIERLAQVEVTAHLDPESGRTYHVPRDPQIIERVTIV